MSDGRYLKRALDLAERGLRVFPIKPNLKFPPLIQEWQNHATTDRTIVNRWWTQWPTANIAVATGRGSGVVILDVDMKHGQNGEAELGKLEAKHGPLPPTVETITPHKGRQLWFRAPEFAVRNSASALASGLDIRGDGGYVVAPPSYVNDKDGEGSYSWSDDSASKFAEVPAWVVAPPPAAELDARRSPEHWKRIVCEGATEGARNTTTASLTGWLLRLGLDFQTSAQLVLGWNARANRPPLDDDEVVMIVRSIAERELRRLGAK
jgi:bifunctional DNA primase/polymerase-like protein/primase-like protein